MKLYKSVIILSLLLLTVGCQSNDQATNELDNENELLKETIASLEENLANKEAELNKINEDINELLQSDKVGGLNTENTYYDLVKDNIVNGYINYEEINIVASDNSLSGIYYVDNDEYNYVFVAFPSFEYVMIIQNKSDGMINVIDGIYSLKNDEMFLNEDIASGGGNIWKYYQTTKNGFEVKIIPPMSTDDDGEIIEFVKM